MVRRSGSLKFLQVANEELLNLLLGDWKFPCGSESNQTINYKPKENFLYGSLLDMKSGYLFVL